MISHNSNRGDVINGAYVAGLVTVGITEVEAKVGGSRLEGRQELIIYNRAGSNIWFGPTGVTVLNGVQVQPGDTVNLPLGDQIPVYMIGEVAGLSVTVQEMR